jgi:hypothetical protein
MTPGKISAISVKIEDRAYPDRRRPLLGSLCEREARIQDPAWAGI